MIREASLANAASVTCPQGAASNPWIQVADYCSWAVFRKWERADARTYDQLVQRIAEPELDALRKGTVRHY